MDMSIIVWIITIAAIIVAIPVQQSIVRAVNRYTDHKDIAFRASLDQFNREYDNRAGEQYRRELIVCVIDQIRQQTGTHNLYFSKQGGTRYKVAPGNIYLISVNDEYYKIGYAKDVAKRIAYMQVSCPYSIELTHIIVTEHTIRLETMLHRRYQDKHVQGEWFMLTQADVADICSIASPITINDLDQLEQRHAD